MSRRERPPAVTRHARSPLWPVVVGLVLCALTFLADDVPAARGNRFEPGRDIRLTGRVLDQEGALRVRYLHPVTEQRVTAHLFVWDHDLAPAPGAAVQLLVRRDDPVSARVEGDVMPVTTNLPVYGLCLVGLSIPVLARRFGLWRSERLAGAASPALAMVGVLAGARRRRRRCELQLYPLDAAAGAAPVCSVPVLVTGGAPIGRPFPVEVKGRPRPLGRVVARSGDVVLWPARRAGRRADHPRPDGAARPVVPLAAAAGPPVPDLPVAAWRELRWELLVVGATVALVALVGAVTVANGRRARDVEAHGPLVVGEVMAREADDTVVVLRYRQGGVARTTRAPVTYAEDFRIGVRYPVRLDPAHPSRARLPAAPYEYAPPLAWAIVPSGAAWYVAWRRWRSWRRNRRAARNGPWSHVNGTRTGADDVVLRNGDGDVVCGARLHGGPRAAFGPRDPLVVAGPAEPGGPVAVWAPDGRRLPLVGAATNAAGAGPAAAGAVLPAGPVAVRDLTQQLVAGAALACPSTVLAGLVGSGLGPAGTAVGALGALAAAAARAASMVLRMDDGGVLVRNPLRTHRHLWAEVAGFVPAGPGELGVDRVGVALHRGPTTPVAVAPLRARAGRGPRMATGRLMAVLHQAGRRFGVPVDLWTPAMGVRPSPVEPTCLDVAGYRAPAPGALPPDGAAVVAGIHLPPGRQVCADRRHGDALGSAGPVLWLTDEVVTQPAWLWAGLRREFPRTGLWPLVLGSRWGDGRRPWDDGELRPGSSSDPGRVDVAAALAGWWVACPPAGVDHPFPGLASGPTGPIDEHAPDAVAAASGPGRLGLVAVTRPADVLAVLGWLGPVHHCDDAGVLSAVLRAWEDRYGAEPVALGFDTLSLAVRRPPATDREAYDVAVEHFAACPGNVWQGPGTLPAYAHGLLGSRWWPFWWDEEPEG